MKRINKIVGKIQSGQMRGKRVQKNQEQFLMKSRNIVYGPIMVQYNMVLFVVAMSNFHLRCKFNWVIILAGSIQQCLKCAPFISATMKPGNTLFST